MNNGANIKSIKIVDVSMKFRIKNSENINLKISTESRILSPKNNDDKTGLYIIKAEILSPDSEQVNITARAEIVFEFDEIPNDYDEAGQKLCLKKAQSAIFDKIGDIMETMGYKRFKIEVPN